MLKAKTVTTFCLVLTAIIISLAVLRTPWMHLCQSTSRTHAILDSEGCQCNEQLGGIPLAYGDPRLVQKVTQGRLDSRHPDVIRLARTMMVPPKGGLLKVIKNEIAHTIQAQAVEKFLGINKTGGFFVECGGFDGEITSNTIYLEKERKWSGLLIEMDPYFYMQLVGKNRRCWSINAGLGVTSYAQQMNYLESDSQIGVLVYGDSKKPHDRSTLCFPLESLLLALNRTHIDYLSLDMEGSEFDVMKSIPFDRITIDVVTAEWGHPIGDPPFIAFMESKGYKFIEKMTKGPHWVMDLLFVHKRIKMP